MAIAKYRPSFTAVQLALLNTLINNASGDVEIDQATLVECRSIIEPMLWKIEAGTDKPEYIATRNARMEVRMETVAAPVPAGPWRSKPGKTMDQWKKKFGYDSTTMWDYGMMIRDQNGVEALDTCLLECSISWKIKNKRECDFTVIEEVETYARLNLISWEDQDKHLGKHWDQYGLQWIEAGTDSSSSAGSSSASKQAGTEERARHPHPQQPLQNSDSSSADRMEDAEESGRKSAHENLWPFSMEELMRKKELDNPWNI